jgi:hypothetical protein
MYGYIDKTGELAIKPQFNEAASFSNGVARVVLGSTRAFVDKSGNVFPADK